MQMASKQRAKPRGRAEKKRRSEVGTQALTPGVCRRGGVRNDHHPRWLQLASLH
jgi:hypothetical protein